MTEQISRQPKGVPTGGQFAAGTHQEPAVTLTRQHPALAGWPDALGEPQLDYALNGDGAVQTFVTVEGRGPATITAWTADPVERTAAWSSSGEWDDVDPRILRQAASWATWKHLSIDSEVNAEMGAAANRARAGLIARATGRPRQVDEAGLQDLIEDSGRRATAAQNEMEQASASLLSRRILDRHPDAATVCLDTLGSDDATWLSLTTVQDANGTIIKDFEDSEPTGDDDEITALASNLDPNADTAPWYPFSVRAEGFNVDSFQDDSFTINLHTAAAWNPGSDQ